MTQRRLMTILRYPSKFPHLLQHTILLALHYHQHGILPGLALARIIVACIIKVQLVI